MFAEVLSNPQSHVEKSFIYLVHGLFDLDKNGKPYVAAKAALVRDPSRFYSGSLVACLDKNSAKRNLGAERGIHRTATMGSLGFILQIPSDDVIYGAGVHSFGDLGTPTDESKLAEWARKHQGEVMPPLDMLVTDKPHQKYVHNELVLRGNPKTKIVGVYAAQSLVDYLCGNNSIPAKAMELRNCLKEQTGEEVPIVLLPYPDPSVKKPAPSSWSRFSFRGLHGGA